MTEWEKVCKYIRGRKGRCILVVLILSLLILSELSGMNMLAAAERGKKEAFRYNGAALCFEGGELDAGKLAALQSTEHVTGIDTRKWWTVDIAPLSNVSWHTGADIPDLGQERYGHEGFLMTNWDVSQDSWFRWEPNVELIQGDYPTGENRGVILEKRLAEENHLQMGDTLSMGVDGQELSLTVCGLFQVNADFELLPESEVDYSEWADEEGAVDVYGCSPYNRIYANVACVYGQLGYGEPGQDRERIWQVYVDDYENVAEVADRLRNILGEEAVLYNYASDYLESAALSVVFMENIAHMIVGGVTVAGYALLIIVMVCFANELKYETGLYLALGRSRRWVLRHDLCIFVLLFLASLGVALSLYCGVCGPILQAVGDFSDAYTNPGSSVGYYRHPGLEERFSLSVGLWDVLSVECLPSMAAGVLLTGGAVMLIPSWCIVKSKATDLFV